MNRFDTEYWVCDVQASIQAGTTEGQGGSDIAKAEQLGLSSEEAAARGLNVGSTQTDPADASIPEAGATGPSSTGRVGASGRPNGTMNEGGANAGNFVADDRNPTGWSYAPDMGLTGEELSAHIQARDLAAEAVGR